MKDSRYYFSTRDLLMLAALAALGGVTSTYVNAIGDFIQSIVGVAGTTQWAAGLHVLWLVLAVGLTRKAGSGTVAGILKGAVELLTGNSHGLLVLLVDIIAGILVDVGFLPFRKKDSTPAYCLAGGLAAASNVFVFQLFASLPADIIAYGALVIVGLVAFGSGVLFAGLLGRVLVNALRRAGVVKDSTTLEKTPKLYPAFLVVAILLTIGFTVFLRHSLAGPPTILINGAVASEYAYPDENGDIESITAEGTLRDTTTRYEGIPIRELVERAGPQSTASLVLIKASDGYAFFIDMDEVETSESLLLAPQGKGEDATYNVVGAENSKAWIRSVAEITVVAPSAVDVAGKVDSPGPYDQNAWQYEMDATRLDVGQGVRKYQGAPLGMVLDSFGLQTDATTVAIAGRDTSGAEMIERLPLAEITANDDIRIFSIVGDDAITFAVATLDSQVIVPDVTRIDVE